MSSIEREQSRGRGDNMLSGKAIINNKLGRFEVYNSDGKVVGTFGEDGLKFYDENGNEKMIAGDVRNRAISGNQFGMIYKDSNNVDKVFLGGDSSGAMETYYIGLLEATITGGSLDGITYSYYILDFYLNHNFSDEYLNLTPLYNVWGHKVVDERQTILANDLGTLSVSGGTSDQYNSHKMFRSYEDSGITDFGAETDEYMLMRWGVWRNSGTVVVASQTVQAIANIIYWNEPLEITSPTTEGGGGGILYESFNFYI